MHTWYLKPLWQKHMWNYKHWKLSISNDFIVLNYCLLTIISTYTYWNMSCLSVSVAISHVFCILYTCIGVCYSDTRARIILSTKERQSWYRVSLLGHIISGVQVLESQWETKANMRRFSEVLVLGKSVNFPRFLIPPTSILWLVKNMSLLCTWASSACKLSINSYLGQ